MTIPVEVLVYHNPWPHSVTDEGLFAIITECAALRAAAIEHRFDTDPNYNSCCLAMTIIDPTAPIWRPSIDSLLATVLIGEDAEECHANGIAKACDQRDSGGNEVGATQSSRPWLLSDGSFRLGFGCTVDGTHGGGSGLNSAQDRREGNCFLSDFNYLVATKIGSWEKLQQEALADAAPSGESPKTLLWRCNQNRPDARFTQAAFTTPLMRASVPAD